MILGLNKVFHGLAVTPAIISSHEKFITVRTRMCIQPVYIEQRGPINLFGADKSCLYG